MAAIEGEKEAADRNLVSQGNAEVASAWNVENFKETVWRRLNTLSLELRAALFPLVVRMMEETINANGLAAWEKRFSDVDREISSRKSRLPKPFSMDFINTARDEGGHYTYPSSRIGLADNKPFDKWLTEYLGSKRPIFFDPYEQWLDRLEEFYDKVYVAKHQEEQEALHPAAPQQEEKPKILPDPTELSGGLAEFRNQVLDERIDTINTLRGRCNRIYKQGGR